MAVIEIPTLEEIKAMVIEVVKQELASRQHVDKEDKILTRNDVKQMLHLGDTTLWKRMKDGSLPYFKVGRKVYFKENDVQAALKNLE